MSDDFVALLLTEMANHGPFILGLSLLFSATGIPIPGTLLVLVAGALVRQGTLDILPSIFLAFMGATIGDSISYYIGALSRKWVERGFLYSYAWKHCKSLFDELGGSVIYLSRFLLTPLAIPANLLAGNSGYSFKAFLFYAAAGEISWLLIYGGIGYLAGARWAVIKQFATDFTGLLLAIFVIILMGYLISRYRSSRKNQDLVVDNRVLQSQYLK